MKKLKLKKLKLNIKKLKLRKLPKKVFDISNEESSKFLPLYWKYSMTSRYRTTMSYLNSRYTKGDLVGDFLKEIIQIKLKLGNTNG